MRYLYVARRLPRSVTPRQSTLSRIRHLCGMVFYGEGSAGEGSNYCECPLTGSGTQKWAPNVKRCDCTVGGLGDHVGYPRARDSITGEPVWLE
jgi:hypothetical protein